MASASLFISIAAFIISLLALWKTHFAPFSALAVAGNLRIRVYPIRSGAERWFIVSLDVPVSITNEGARPGMIRDLRLRLHFREVPVPDNCEIFHVTFEIASEDAQRVDSNRFKWIDEIVVGEWMPFTVLPKATVTKHFIFEHRWEKSVVHGITDCTLEMRSDPGEWKHVTTWHVALPAGIWKQMEEGSSIAFPPEDEHLDKVKCVPADLHKYLATAGEGTDSGDSKQHDSFLDYPTNR